MRVLLAVCGSVSFYKAFEILSALKAAGAAVRVALSPGALRFCQPLAFEALAEAVLAENACWQPGSLRNHIAFSRGCDGVLVAPASANSINAIAAGRADSEFLACILAAQDLPLLLAPAANSRMLEGITAASLQALAERGAQVIAPVTKRLACGEIGAGGLAAPEQIAETALHFFAATRRKKAGQRALKITITSGGTREKIDAVRVLSNLSSGRFGAAIARAAYLRGHEILHAAAGAADENALGKRVRGFASSAELAALMSERADVIISAAAVADFIPEARPGKLQRADFGDKFTLRGRPAADLLAAADAGLKVAFKLEASGGEAALLRAAAAMQSKGAAMCVLNSLDEMAFGSEESRIKIILRADAVGAGADGAPSENPIFINRNARACDGEEKLIGAKYFSHEGQNFAYFEYSGAKTALAEKILDHLEALAAANSPAQNPPQNPPAQQQNPPQKEARDAF